MESYTATTIAGEEVTIVKEEIAEDGTEILVNDQGAAYVMIQTEVETDNGTVEVDELKPYVGDHELGVGAQSPAEEIVESDEPLPPTEDESTGESDTKDWSADDHAAGGQQIAGQNPPETAEEAAEEEAAEEQTADETSEEEEASEPEAEKAEGGVTEEPIG